MFHQDTFAEITKDSSKLWTYSVRGYLAALTKFRHSNHNLMIEKDRHFKVEKAKRFCPFCQKTMETELHFLVHCNTFACLCRKLFSTIRQKPNNFHNLSGPQNTYISLVALVPSDMWYPLYEKACNAGHFSLKIRKTVINQPSLKPTLSPLEK